MIFMEELTEKERKIVEKRVREKAKWPRGYATREFLREKGISLEEYFRRTETEKILFHSLIQSFERGESCEGVVQSSYIKILSALNKGTRSSKTLHRFVWKEYVSVNPLLKELKRYGLIEVDSKMSRGYRYRLTRKGKRFLAWLYEQKEFNYIPESLN